MIRLTAIFSALALAFVSAHESPEHTIEHLDAALKQQRTAPKLYQRAMAYRSLGHLEKSRADLVEAVKMAPKSLLFHLELGNLELAARNSAGALEAATHAMPLAQNAEQKSRVHMLRAEAYHLGKQYKPSLQACQLAFRAVPEGEIEWFLLRSENQRALGQHRERIAGLAAGIKRHPSAVLQSHWVDAQIDAGQFDAALKIIDAEISDRRWTSGWLVKLARALYGLKQNAAAETALYAALEEIQERLNPEQPDPFLLADQGIAHALLGNRAGAKNNLQKLHQHHAPPWLTSRLAALLK
ncbi:hypothetical protein JIN77_04130 [Verrucomicrobiaceae bacterium R5-34]|nr:hypothetical protein [Verrucomicrobiaceae bacterium R5-34]